MIDESISLTITYVPASARKLVLDNSDRANILSNEGLLHIYARNPLPIYITFSDIGQRAHPRRTDLSFHLVLIPHPRLLWFLYRPRGFLTVIVPTTSPLQSAIGIRCCKH